MANAESPGLIVVALHKSGTNLIGRLLSLLGYKTLGPGVGNMEELHREARLRQERGQGSIPDGQAWFLHQLDYRQMPEDLLRSWISDRQPQIIFHYRDPRAVLLSELNYLLCPEKWGEGFGTSSQVRLYSDLFAQLSPERRVSKAIDLLGNQVQWAFDAHLWLLHHPHVCKTTFERLVGPQGGGDAGIQLREVKRVCRFLGRSGDAGAIAARVYSRKARTFFRGDLQAWREEFDDDALETFQQRYGNVLREYGYGLLGRDRQALIGSRATGAAQGLFSEIE